jgi:hypothetical protein
MSVKSTPVPPNVKTNGDTNSVNSLKTSSVPVHLNTNLVKTVGTVMKSSPFLLTSLLTLMFLEMDLLMVGLKTYPILIGKPSTPCVTSITIGPLMNVKPTNVSSLLKTNGDKNTAQTCHFFIVIVHSLGDSICVSSLGIVKKLPSNPPNTWPTTTKTMMKSSLLKTTLIITIYNNSKMLVISISIMKLMLVKSTLVSLWLKTLGEIPNVHLLVMSIVTVHSWSNLVKDLGLVKILLMPPLIS